jgi:hypothetical protein
VLLREGLAAWIARRSACSTPAQAVTRSHRREAMPQLGDGERAGIVQVLASMAMGHKETTA